ncbi:MAG: hypothetical protein IIA61_13380 [Candidatus Marinimicrobia bacterium]|nr:hypothetical protein [Candidatus Neomarinimicrobiota bacterium]
MWKLLLHITLPVLSDWVIAGRLTGRQFGQDRLEKVTIHINFTLIDLIYSPVL